MYDVIVQVANAERTRPRDIRDIRARQNGAMISLANLIDVDERVSPRELNRFSQRRAVVISANLAPATRWARRWVHGRCRQPAAAAGLCDRLCRPVARFKTSSSSLALTFVLAGLHLPGAGGAVRKLPRSLIIMLTVPLSMTGALLALLLAGGTLNVYSQIGLVTLVGLITKHGILIVEFANQLQERRADQGR